ncbi:hypothetical protein JXO52_11935 [bacterium]|nr:hypothetical protein [bacterium]
MYRQVCILWCGILLLISACSGVNDSRDNDPGYTTYQMDVVYDGGILTCYVTIPDAAYQSPVQMPLLIGMHYGDPNPYTAGLEFLENILIPAFQRLDPFIISPACPGEQPNGWTGPDAEKGIQALLDSVRAWYPVDTTKIALIGYSMGGAGAWHLLEKWPERFCAAVPVASLPPAAVTDPEKYPRVCVINGTADELVSIGDVRSRVTTLIGQGLDIRLIEGQGYSHYQATTYLPEIKVASEWLREIWGLDPVKTD